MDITKNKHRTIFAPDLVGRVSNHCEEDKAIQDLTKSQTWISRQASQDSSLQPSRSITKAPFNILIRDCNPFKDHDLSYQTELGGFVDVCINSRSKKVVVIKKVGHCTRAMLHQLKPTTHDNIVHFSSAYHFEESIYLVYERTLVCLEEVAASPRGRLPISAVASTSLSILKGLAYLHEDLKMTHGVINAENILLNHNGQIKIANIGEIMLRTSQPSEQQRDVRDFSTVLRDLLEPGSCLLDPHSSILQRPGQCHDGARSLLAESQSTTATNLCKHQFLQSTDGTMHLMMLVLSTAASRSCQVIIPGSNH